MGIAHYNMPPAPYTDLKKMRWPTEGKEKITHRGIHTAHATATEDKRSHREKNMPSIRFEFYPDSVYGARGRCIMGFIFPRLGFTYIYDLRHYSNKTSYGFIYLFFLLSTYIITSASASSIAITSHMLTQRRIASVIIMANTYGTYTL